MGTLDCRSWYGLVHCLAAERHQVDGIGDGPSQTAKDCGTGGRQGHPLPDLCVAASGETEIDGL